MRGVSLRSSSRKGNGIGQQESQEQEIKKWGDSPFYGVLMMANKGTFSLKWEFEGSAEKFVGAIMSAIRSIAPSFFILEGPYHVMVVGRGPHTLLLSYEKGIRGDSSNDCFGWFKWDEIREVSIGFRAGGVTGEVRVDWINVVVGKEGCMITVGV